MSNKKYKIVAWNVNGIRSLMKKNESDLLDLIASEKPHIICFGETKLSCPIIETEEMLKEKINGYKYRYYSPCLIRKGYSGTAVFSKRKPKRVIYGLDGDTLDDEGRVITLEFDKFYLVHVYTPNSGEGLKRLEYRINTWDKRFRKYIKSLNKKVILCGDLNVAHQEIDIHNPKGNKRSAGFTNEERNSFDKTLTKLNLIDTYRHLNPDTIEYTYWSYRGRARVNNKGWRIDYFLVSENLINKVKQSYILTDVIGSDHCPIVLSLDI